DYNADGTIKDQVDGNSKMTSYGYDALARVTSITDPLNRTTTSTYDGVGNLLTITDPRNQTTTYTYDAANELTSISYSDGRTPNVSNIQYDADGQRTQMTDGTGTSSWSYDDAGHLHSVTDWLGNVTTFGYDANSNLTT